MLSRQPLTRPLHYNDTTITDAAFSPDGRYLAAGTREGTVVVWDVFPGKEPEKFFSLFHEAKVEKVDFSHDGRRLLTVTARPYRIFRVWDLTSSASDHKQFGHQAPLTAAAFSPTGKQIATATEEGVVKGWKIDSGQLSFKLEHSGAFRVGRRSGNCYQVPDTTERMERTRYRY